jgi:hypothetical protein
MRHIRGRSAAGGHRGRGFDRARATCATPQPQPTRRSRLTAPTTGSLPASLAQCYGSYGTGTTMGYGGVYGGGYGSEGGYGVGAACACACGARRRPAAPACLPRAHPHATRARRGPPVQARGAAWPSRRGRAAPPAHARAPHAPFDRPPHATCPHPQYGCPAPPPIAVTKDTLMLAGGLADCEVSPRRGGARRAHAMARRPRRRACAACPLPGRLLSARRPRAAAAPAASHCAAHSLTALLPPPRLSPARRRRPQGLLTPYGQEFVLATGVLTNLAGNFSTDSSLPGSVAFPPFGCRDNLIAATAKFWSFAPTSPGVVLRVSPVSGLAEALRRFRCNTGGAGDCLPIGAAGLVQDVYTRLFGFPAATDVDYESWSKLVIGSKFGVAVYVINQRVATALTLASEVVSGACGAGFDASLNAYVQTAVSYAVVETLMPLQSKPARRAALSDATALAALTTRALHNVLTPEAGPLTCRALLDAQGTELIDELAKVGGPCLLGDQGAHSWSPAAAPARRAAAHAPAWPAPAGRRPRCRPAARLPTPTLP